MTQPTTGPRLRYRSPHAGIAGREDYPNAPISIVLDGSTPGADLFGVSVAIGGDIPLHSHSMMEFQFVVSGTGLALDADGGETPIAPGGTVLSPAGPGGAHRFRNTGPLPLTLLCVYPSPGGATPDRSPFLLGTTAPVDGPRSVYMPPQDLAAVPLHEHPVCELLYVISGVGLAIDREGVAVAIGPGGVVICPAGPSGAHGLRSTGSLPLQVLSVLPSPGGVAPSRMDVDELPFI